MSRVQACGAVLPSSLCNMSGNRKTHANRPKRPENRHTPVMASPGVNWTFTLLLLLGSIYLTSAATVTYDFDISWVIANPDGLADRPTIGINGKWPIPRIDANVGDQIIVNVVNSLGNQSTSLHFHGLFMNGSTHMDGPSQTTQCPIPPGGRFTYDFTVEQPGTYWYHSHTHGQYPDGLRGPLIVHDPENPFKEMYDEELVLTVSDWYHDQMPGLLSFFISKANPTGAEPVPHSALLNETQNLTIAVQPGKTYLFRTINIGAFAGQYVWFEGHNMTILEVDGVYTQPAKADMIYLSAAQRCSFLITAKENASTNFPIVASMDTVSILARCWWYVWLTS
jgi:iron transport multicopper oxidase